MFGVVTPSLKLSLMYKCRGFVHKFKPILLIMPKKCPLCGWKKLKTSVGFVEEPSGSVVY